MHFILFLTSAQEATVLPFGLDVLGDEDLDRIKAGDVVWIVTRLDEARRSPGLCGRLVVAGVEAGPVDTSGSGGERGGWTEGLARVGSAGDVGGMLSGQRRARRLVVHPDGSGRCAPFMCDAIRSWDIWRRQFNGVTPLSIEQGTTLQTVWERQAPHE